MFKSLIKVIFPSVSSGEIAPSFEYFQQTKLNPPDDDERTNVITHPRNQSENINDEHIKKIIMKNFFMICYLEKRLNYARLVLLHSVSI